MGMNRKLFEKIQIVLHQFPDVDNFYISESPSNGIGRITVMKFDTVQNGVVGQFEVEVSGVDDW